MARELDIVCPHCKHMQDDSYGYAAHNQPEEWNETLCNNCEKEFMVMYETDIFYNTKTKES